MIIAIDGPAGSGKGTVAKKLAKKLGFAYIDSGSFYRVVAFYVYDNQIAPDDAAKITALLPQLQIELHETPRGQRVVSQGRDLTDEIRYELVSRIVSPVSRVLAVRRWVNQYVKKFAADHDVVVEGRDMTTVVFPQAEWKFYLDADLDERARRRYLELKNKDSNVTLAGIKEEIEQRDRLDRSKPQGALRIAPGAVYIDSTKQSPQQVTDFIIAKVKRLKTGA